MPNSDAVLFPRLIASVFVMFLFLGAVWTSFVWWLFRRLRTHHPAAYESIGSPSLFWDNSPRKNLQFLRFLQGSQWKELPDPKLIKVCRLMAVLMYCYILGFLGLLALFISWHPPKF